MIPLEICVESLASSLAAEQGGAQRVELCSALSEGGLTPSLGLIRAVRQQLKIGVYVMIRPRGGDFIYSPEEIAIMREDIRVAAAAGVDGVVLGVLTSAGNVDVEQTSELVELARPMEVTFHRAFDMSRDLEASIEDVIRTGAARVLTSGGEATAVLGITRLRRLIGRTDGRIEVMVGSGVRPETIAGLAESLDLARASDREKIAFHASLRRTIPSRIQSPVRNVSLGDAAFEEVARSEVRAEDVRSLRNSLEAALSIDAGSPGMR